LPAKPVYEDAPLMQSLTTSLLDSLSASQSLAGTWKCLKRMKLSREVAEQLQKVANKLPPTDLVQVIEIISTLRDDSLDGEMLDQLVSLKAARAIPTSTLVNLYRDRSDSLKSKAKKVADQLLQSDPQTKQTVQTLLGRLPAGDPIRGLTLYHSTKANCGACHQMGYRGGKIGPELSKIGSARTAEALLEAILFPSQRIEQGFETVSVLIDDGRVLNGIVTAKYRSCPLG
jgi:predicted transcriptional regulator